MTIVPRAIATCLVVLLAALIGAGCSHSEARKASGIDRIRYLELRHLAETRLQCSHGRLSYEYEGDKVHVIHGCGETVRYLIFSIGNIWVKIESFHERATFELKCNIKRLRTERVNESTWRVKGCGRTTYYSLRCERDGKECSWENVTEGDVVFSEV